MSRPVLSLRRFTSSFMVIATSALSLVGVVSSAGALTPASPNWLQVGAASSGPPLRTPGPKWAPDTRPTPREAAAMVYTPPSPNVVLFGGIASGGRLADTWTWDG